MNTYYNGRPERDASSMSPKRSRLPCDNRFYSLDNVKYNNEDRFLVNPCQKKHKCPLCKQLLSDPVQTTRGELACRNCYQKNQRQDGNCPIDGEPIGDVFPDRFTFREINNLQCICLNEKYGCQWIGSLIDISTHEERCEYRMIKCKSCQDNVINKWIDEHNKQKCIHRAMECQFCNRKIQFVDMEEHEATCENRPLPCPFNCQETLTRAEAYLHINKCRNIQAGVICPYYGFGCTFKPTNSESLSLHLNSDSLSHVGLAVNSVNIMKKEARGLTYELSKEKSRTSLLENELQQVKDRMSTMSHEHERQMKAMTEIQLTAGKQQKTEELGSSVSEAYNRLKDLEGCMSNFQFEKDESFQKLLSMLSKLDNIIPSKDLTNYLQSKKDLEQLSENLDLFETKQAHCISQLSDAELNLQLLENTAYNGHMIWRIDNISYRNKQAEIGKITVLHSAPCYTKMFEYKFCSRLYLNGDGVGKCSHLSLFVCFMKSPFDDQLDWPVHKKVTFRLLHPGDKTKSRQEEFITDTNSSSFKKPEREMNMAAGFSLFIEKENIFREGFVVDDSIYIETIVE